MSKKLDKVLKDVLDKPLDEAVIATAMPGYYSAQADAMKTPAEHKRRRGPAYSEMGGLDDKCEPQDKLLVAIQHLFINGEFDRANALIKEYGGKGLFTWYHMEQLIDWVRNIYKYTNMKDLSKNYYTYQVQQGIEGVDTLEKVRIKDELVDKFTKDVEKVLNKKLSMR